MEIKVFSGGRTVTISANRMELTYGSILGPETFGISFPPCDPDKFTMASVSGLSRDQMLELAENIQNFVK